MNCSRPMPRVSARIIATSSLRVPLSIQAAPCTMLLSFWLIPCSRAFWLGSKSDLGAESTRIHPG